MGKKVLIVDDDKTNRLLLKTILSKKYEVEEAENGVEALEKLSPDIGIILLDLMMPLMDGIKFLEILRLEKPEYSNLPVVVLTTDDSKRREALAAGANEVIIKPINPVEILDKVASYIS